MTKSVAGMMVKEGKRVSRVLQKQRKTRIALSPIKRSKGGILSYRG